jgi:hypothetical protein
LYRDLERLIAIHIPTEAIKSEGEDVMDSETEKEDEPLEACPTESPKSGKGFGQAVIISDRAGSALEPELLSRRNVRMPTAGPSPYVAMSFDAVPASPIEEGLPPAKIARIENHVNEATLVKKIPGVYYDSKSRIFKVSWSDKGKRFHRNFYERDYSSFQEANDAAIRCREDADRAREATENVNA